MSSKPGWPLAGRLVGGLLLVAAPVYAHTDTVAVLYPEVDEPYLSVFRAIAKGVEQGGGNTIKEYRLRKDEAPEAVSQWLREERVDGAVSLGSRGYKLAQTLSGSLPTVVGGLPIAPDGIPGVSLVPSPESVAGHLKSLVAQAGTVHVVYGPQSAWLLPLAETALHKRGMALDARPADSLQAAARQYAELLPALNGPEHALWLLTDPFSADEQVILPLVLKAAWEQNFVLFSSTPAHLKRGALFTLIPDNAAMGESLARLLAEVKRSPGQKTVWPAESLGLAVNLRTAGHLGLRFSAEQERSFQLVFPPR